MRENALKEGAIIKDKQTTSQQFMWVDLIKAIALFGVFLNHIVERILGFPQIANPKAAWPPFSERLAQLSPLTGHGAWNVPLNLLRWTGWFGEHGVELFLIISGFGLTWGLLTRYGNGDLPIRKYYFRRAERIYPLWWGAHLVFMAIWLLTNTGLSMTDPNTYLSLLGIRLTEAQLYYFSPAWWYVGLLLQLYLIYPLLWNALRRWGPWKLLLVGCSIAFVARALGSLVFKDYLDAWLRGAVFITRLPEFLFGISLAFWFYRDPKRTGTRLCASSTQILAIAACIVSFPLALTLPGMSVVPFLLGTGLFLLLYALLVKITNSGGRTVKLGTWIGRHSFSLYLIHHPFVRFLLPAGPVVSAKRALVGVFLVVLSTVVGAVTLEFGVHFVQGRLRNWNLTIGTLRTAMRVVFLIIGVAVLFVSSDLAVRRFAPQEVLGWGERPSLEPDATLGWRLKPSQTTRLRWEGYDYKVTSNSLGFPGPAYPEHKDPGTIRIMTVGDAFTSAEGVNTEQAWPRLLETDLARQIPSSRVEVMNFGITAYGPVQYALLFERYAPIYRPDILIIGFFVNEYEDVRMNIEEFRAHIGFDLPSQYGLHALIKLAHLRSFIKLEILQPLKELLLKEPRGHGYFLGNFSALEKGRTDLTVVGRQLVKERLEQIKVLADKLGTKIVIAMIPASVQVCRPKQLAYFPHTVDLSDSNRFDLEQPQQMTREIAEQLAIPYFDLRPALRSVPEGRAYQSKNMHWTPEGHRAVAHYLTEVLTTELFMPSRRQVNIDGKEDGWRLREHEQ